MKKDYLDDYTNNFFFRFSLDLILSIIAAWDKRMTSNVDNFISISKHIKKRIKTIYLRDSELIYPSINYYKYSDVASKKSNYYVAASRFVPYKKIDLVIKVFNDFPKKKLIIIGDGEKFDEYKKLSLNNNIKFLGWVPEDEKISIFAGAKALIYPPYEDFGIVPVEAQACGTPVIGFGKGGVRDTVIAEGKNKTGIFFKEQTIQSVKKAISKFDNNESEFLSIHCKENAKRFDHSCFKKSIKSFILNSIKSKTTK